MKIIALGTAGYHPNEQRQTSCYILPESGVVFDAGTAMYRVSKHLQTKRLDIFLSHAHVDHTIGLTYLLEIMHVTPLEEVIVHGEEEKLNAVEKHLFHELIFPVKPQFKMQPLDSGTKKSDTKKSAAKKSGVKLPDGGIVRHFNMVHPGGVVGYRVDWPDRSLAYVTDTTTLPDSEYLQQIRGVDVLIHECNFTDEHKDLAIKTGHSWTSAVAQAAAAAGVKSLYLTHINPLDDSGDPVGLESARQIFPNTELLADGSEIEF